MLLKYLQRYLAPQRARRRRRAAVPYCRPAVEQLEGRVVPYLSGSSSTFLITEGQPISGKVGSFTDSISTDVASQFTATIRWGDGSTSQGKVTQSYDGFDVTGSKVYTEANDYQIGIDVKGGTGVQGETETTILSWVTVSDATFSPRIAPTGEATVGQAFSGEVGEFVDNNPYASGNDYSLTIYWGDNSSSSGQLGRNYDGSFVVTGSHAYQSSGLYFPEASVRDKEGASVSAGTRIVVKAPVLAAAVVPFHAYEGVRYAGPVGAVAVVPASAADGLGLITGSVNWGDGTEEYALFEKVGGQFIVLNSHTYRESGTWTVRISASDVDNSTTASAAVTVEDKLFAAGSTALTPVEGVGFQGPVALFEDPNTASQGGDFQTKIDWGDGTTSGGSVQDDGIDSKTGFRQFTVLGQHTYADEGNDAIGTDITDETTTISVASTARVADAPLAAQGATVRVPFTTPSGWAVAAFADANPAAPVTDFSAMITWGDGSSSAGTIQKDPDGSHFDVIGKHSYGTAPEGTTFAVGVTVKDVGGSTATASSSAAVTDYPLAAAVASFKVTEGAAFAGAVAAFRDADPSPRLSDFSATVDWGDGTTSAGAVAPSGAVFAVSAGHTYAEGGTYPVTVTVHDRGGASASAQGSAAVADLPLVGPVPKLVAAAEGVAFSGVAVAGFADANPKAVAGEYKVTVAWGDGTSSPGTVVARAGGFDVVAGHAYAEEGSYAVAVQVADAGGSTLGIASRAAVADAPLAGVGGALRVAEGAAFGGAVASFADGNPAASAADFTATVAWGDGTSSAGTVASNPGGGFIVSGAHSYAGAEEGATFPVAVVVKDAGGSTVTMAGTVTVIDAPLAAAGTSLDVPSDGAFNGRVASVTDANPVATPSDLSAVISWGDGAQSSGSVEVNPAGGFVVVGSHDYAPSQAAPVTVHVVITDKGGSVASADSIADLSVGVHVVAGGGPAAALAVSLNGVRLVSGTGGAGGARGLTAAVIDPRNPRAFLYAHTYDTWSDKTQLEPLRRLLETPPAGAELVLVANDEAGLVNWATNAPWFDAEVTAMLLTLQSLGSKKIASVPYRGPWAMVEVVGQGVVAEGTAPAEQSLSLDARLPAVFADPDRLAAQIGAAVAAAAPSSGSASDFITLPAATPGPSELSVRAQGGPAGGVQIVLDNSAIFARSGGAGGGRGVTVAVIDQANRTFSARVFDTWAQKDEFLSLASYLQAVPDGSLMVVAVGDEGGFIDWSSGLQWQSPAVEAGYAAIEALGATQVRKMKYRGGYVLVLQKGHGVLAEQTSDPEVALSIALNPPA